MTALTKVIYFNHHFHQPVKKGKSQTQHLKYLPTDNPSQPQSSIENKNTEELKRKPTHRQFYQDLERPSLDKTNIPGMVM